MAKDKNDPASPLQAPPGDGGGDQDAAGAPEVEAEVVTPDENGEAGGAPTNDTGFDDHDGLDEPEDNEAPAAKRKFLASPGVALFVVFAVTALLVFAAWRLQSWWGGQSSLEPPQEASESALKSVPAPAPTSSPIPDPGSASSKIANDAAADIDKSQLPTPAEKAPDAAALAQSGLAANKGVGDNLALQEEAKDALGALEEETASDRSPETVPDLEPAGEGAIEGARQAAAQTPPSDEITPDTDKIANLAGAELGALKSEITQLKGALDEERARNQTQRQEIAQLREEFKVALAARAASDNQKIAALEARLDKIQNDAVLQAARRARALIALSALERVQKDGAPFLGELSVLASLAPNAPEITVLGQYAADGAPSAGALAADFEGAARAALKAAQTNEKKGFWANFFASFRALVTIRPAAPAAGQSVSAVISRADAHIGEGDFAAARAELEALSGPARRAIDPWLEKARARADIDAAIAALTLALTREP